MNYPSNFNSTAFERTIGSRISDGEQVLDGLNSHVCATINRAFDEYPVTAGERWKMIKAAIEHTDATLGAFVDLNAEELRTAADEFVRAIDANAEGDKASVMQALAAYMQVWQGALDRREMEL